MICVIHRWFMVNQRNPDSCLPSVVCSWVWIPPSKSSTLKDLANDKTSLQQLEAAGSRGFCWWTTKYWKDLEIHSRLFWDNDINWLTNNEYQLYHNWKYIPWHYNWFDLTGYTSNYTHWTLYIPWHHNFTWLYHIHIGQVKFRIIRRRVAPRRMMTTRIGEAIYIYMNNFRGYEQLFMMAIYIWQCVKTLYPCSSHQNSWDLWMFIPLKMYL